MLTLLLTGLVLASSLHASELFEMKAKLGTYNYVMVEIWQLREPDPSERTVVWQLARAESLNAKDGWIKETLKVLPIVGATNYPTRLGYFTDTMAPLRPSHYYTLYRSE